MLSFLNLIHIFFIHSCIAQLQSTTVNTFTPSQNGVSVSYNTKNTKVSGAYYDISVTTQNEYDVAISLQEQWSFKSTLSTTLILTLNGLTPNPSADADFIILFTTDNIQFFSFFVHLDSTVVRSKIYPFKKLAIQENLFSYLENTITYPQRWDRVSHGDQWSNTRPRYNGQAQWPLKFQITNNITSNKCIFSYYDQGNIYQTGNTFNDTFIANKPINIYIMGDTSNEQYQISDINIQLYTHIPTNNPTKTPSINPTNIPSHIPSQKPTINPSHFPTQNPSFIPTKLPTNIPSQTPIITHHITNNATTYNPSNFPTNIPSNFPSNFPTNIPSNFPTYNPSNFPTNNPSLQPTIIPTFNPTKIPISPTFNPTGNPSQYPTPAPSIFPTDNPTGNPSVFSWIITKFPVISPSNFPTQNPSLNAINSRTNNPSLHPTISPSLYPTISPTLYPTLQPTQSPIKLTSSPITAEPTISPTNKPSNIPTILPSTYPSVSPSNNPSISPTISPIIYPSNTPTIITINPSNIPTISPSNNPSISPTIITINPSNTPTLEPTIFPTYYPTNDYILPTDNINQIILTEHFIRESPPFNWIVVAIFMSVACCSVFILLMVARINETHKKKIKKDKSNSKNNPIIDEQKHDSYSYEKVDTTINNEFSHINQRSLMSTPAINTPAINITPMHASIIGKDARDFKPRTYDNNIIIIQRNTEATDSEDDETTVSNENENENENESNQNELLYNVIGIREHGMYEETETKWTYQSGIDDDDEDTKYTTTDDAFLDRTYPDPFKMINAISFSKSENLPIKKRKYGINYNYNQKIEIGKIGNKNRRNNRVNTESYYSEDYMIKDANKWPSSDDFN